MEIYKMSNRISGNGNSGESERYWDNALKRCLNRMLQLLKLADKEISIKNMRRLITSAPMEDEVANIHEMQDEDILKWGESNFCIGCLMDAGGKVEGTEKEEDYELIHDYFFREFAKLPEKTRSTVVESFLGLAEPFSMGVLKKHFSGRTNIQPELTHEGKIIIMKLSG